MGEVRAVMFDFNGKAPRDIACIYVPLIGEDGKHISDRYYSCGDRDDKKKFRKSTNGKGFESESNQPLNKQAPASIFLLACMDAEFSGSISDDLSVLDGTVWTWDRRSKRSLNEEGQWVADKFEIYPVKYVGGGAANAPAPVSTADDEAGLEMLADWLVDNLAGETSKADVGKMVRGADDPSIVALSAKVYGKELAALLGERGVEVKGNQFIVS